MSDRGTHLPRRLDFETRWFHLRLELWTFHVRLGVVMVGAGIFREEDDINVAFGLTLWRFLP